MRYIKNFGSHDKIEIDEMTNENLLEDPNFIAGASTLALVGGSFLISLIKDLKGANKEERKEILRRIAEVIEKRAGN